MKTKLILLLTLSLLAGFATACYPTLDGHSRAGVPFKRDRYESRYEKSLDQVVSAAREVIKFNGTLTSEDVVTKTLIGKIDTRTVWIKVDEIEPKITRVVTQVRGKNGGSDLDMTRELDKQIAIRLVR